MSAVLNGLDEVVEAMLSLNVDVTIGEKDGIN
jgi:hypothetical protein